MSAIPQPAPYIVLAAVSLAVLAFAGSAPNAQQPPPPPSVKVGEQAPDFALSYLEAGSEQGRFEERKIRLSDFRGKENVVLAFFPAAFSPG
jgi:hypothetical protein